MRILQAEMVHKGSGKAGGGESSAEGSAEGTVASLRLCLQLREHTVVCICIKDGFTGSSSERATGEKTNLLQALECAWPTPQGFMCGNKLTAGTNSSVHSAPVSMRTG